MRELRHLSTGVLDPTARPPTNAPHRARKKTFPGLTLSLSPMEATASPGEHPSSQSSFALQLPSLPSHEVRPSPHGTNTLGGGWNPPSTPLTASLIPVLRAFDTGSQVFADASQGSRASTAWSPSPRRVSTNGRSKPALPATVSAPQSLVRKAITRRAVDFRRSGEAAVDKTVDALRSPSLHTERKAAVASPLPDYEERASLSRGVTNALARPDGPNLWQRVLLLPSFFVLLRRLRGREEAHRRFGGVAWGLSIPFIERLRLVSKIQLFSALTEAELAWVAGEAQTALVPRYTRVQRAHSRPQALHVVVAGSLASYDDTGRQFALSPGDSFGHMALGPNGPTPYCEVEVVSAKPTLLLRIERARLEASPGFERLLATTASHLDEKVKEQLLSRMPLFFVAGPELCAQLVPLCSSLELRAGATVYFEGDVADVVFLLVRGAIQLRKELNGPVPSLLPSRLDPPQAAAEAHAPPLHASGSVPALRRRRTSRRQELPYADSQHLLTIRHNDRSPWFGEGALFRTGVRLHTATCTEDVQLLTLARHHFDEFRSLMPVSLKAALRASSAALEAAGSSPERSWQELNAVSKDLAERARERFAEQEAERRRWKAAEARRPSVECVWSRAKQHGVDFSDRLLQTPHMSHHVVSHVGTRTAGPLHAPRREAPR